MKTPKLITNNRIVRLFKKYTITLLILEILTRWGTLGILRLFQNYYQLNDISEIQTVNNLVLGSSTFIFNLIVGIIVLFDLNRKNIWTWIIFCWTLLNPWTSIIFLLICKIIDMEETKHNSL